MREIKQAAAFYNSLSEAQKKELIEAVAEDIFFLDDELQFRIIELLSSVEPLFAEAVKTRNNFTI